MARHRWATSPPTRGVFNLQQDSGGTPDFTGEPEAFGEPGSFGERSPRGGGRRWAVGRGAALIALGLAMVAAVALFVLRGGPPQDVVSVDLADPGSSQHLSGAGPEDGETFSPGAPQPGERAGNVSATEPPTPAGSAAPVPGLGDESFSEPLLVHVAGAVSRPGIVELESGSRVFEAVEKAGGALPDADLAAINLASPVQDGLQIRVPLQGETLAPAGTHGASTGKAAPNPTGAYPAAPPGTPNTNMVNINTADIQELETLPRIGPVLAERIVAWRTENGGFSRPEDLDAVPGIGEAMLAALVPLVTV